MEESPRVSNGLSVKVDEVVIGFYMVHGVSTVD